MADNIAIKVDNVKKDFHLLRDKNDSIKLSVIEAFKKRDKGADTLQALRGVSFEVKSGEFFGIVGRNGSGKSTLLKMIADIYQPTSGKVSHKGKLVSFIELGVGFTPNLTGRENVYLNGALLGFSRKEIDARYDEIVAFAELEKFMDQPLRNYSSGMKVRLAFSVATHADADILVLDEVLAVGDAAFQRKCNEYFQSLKERSKTIVLVTHSMSNVRQYCDRAILIDKGVVAHEGSADEVADAYTAMFSESKTSSHRLGKRIGSGEVRFRDINVKVTEKNVIIDCAIEARADVTDVMINLNVRDDKNLVATMPKHMKKEQQFNVKTGTNKHIIFTFDNIFGGENYHINAKLKSPDDLQVYDWWRNAAGFTNKDRPKIPTMYPLHIKSS